jgi:hypothetical protein
VGVDVQGDCDVGVSEASREHLDRHAGDECGPEAFVSLRSGEREIVAQIAPEVVATA